jgi:hypothetical protein
MIRVALITLALASCGPWLDQHSVGPPGRSARLDSDVGFWGVRSYTIELSKGVAVALTCYRGEPCTQLRVSSDDPAIAEVRYGSLNALSSNSSFGSPASSIVVIGKAPGSTVVRIRSEQGDRDVPVRVIPAPGSVQAMAR